jgi:hypothetical protein
MSSAWDPVHHEEIEDDEPTAAARGARQNGRAKESGGLTLEGKDVTPGVSFLAGLSMMVPPDVLAAINAIADGQKELAEKLDDLTATMADGFAALAESLTQNHTQLGEGIGQAVGRASQDSKIAVSQIASQIGEHMKGVQEVAAGNSALAEQMKGWTESVEKAILAPRKVSLRRDKEGRAVGAISEVREV